MKKVFAVAGMMLALAACNKVNDKATNTAREARIQKIIDSAVSAQKKDLLQKYNDDLEMRITIEVKGKADSIVAARAKADTLKRPHTAMPDRKDTMKILSAGRLLHHGR